MRESELSLGLFRANCGLFGPIGAYFLRENADSTQIGGVQPCPRMGDTAHLGSAQSAERSALLQPSSAHFPHAPNIEVEQHDRDGCLLSEQFDAPVIDSLERLTLPCRVALEKLAGDPRSMNRIGETPGLLRGDSAEASLTQAALAEQAGAAKRTDEHLESNEVATRLSGQKKKLTWRDPI
ncbi:MAG TPA: hypothetical protein PLS93_16160 [Accumulibacter sp.]|nr:hypothetical protein [Accumulibacter sp.]